MGGTLACAIGAETKTEGRATSLRNVTPVTDIPRLRVFHRLVLTSSKYHVTGLNGKERFVEASAACRRDEPKYLYSNVTKFR